jgi:hypothetical protein
MAKALALMACVASVKAIYSDNHFDMATKLTTDNFEATVKAEVDAGRTFFVRWIASAG